ncbi:hypothetical protein KR084_008615 [Drosophila pseudotakahashii]|nr:hypothetical protein KR084_008615 [Drosophila pseudotakahashii]
MVVTAACCRCGSDSEPYALPFCVGGAGYEYHCFCCAKTPPRQCINCNAPGDLKCLRNLNEKHEKCCKGEGNLHIFVFTQPWPPFPEKIAEPEARNTVGEKRSKEPPPAIEIDMLIPNPSTFADQEEPVEPLQPETDLLIPNPMILDEEEEEKESQEPPLQSALELMISSPRTLSEIDFDSQETITVDTMNEEKDIKPSTQDAGQKWVTPSEILTWPQCPRCKKVRIKNSGWVTHAQKCGQNQKYKNPKFYIYCHTKGWCDYLVRDSLWENHSDPIAGSCDLCRSMRREGKPLPFMPKAPERPNEVFLAKKRRNKYRLNKKRKELLSKRRLLDQTEAPQISLD